MIFPNNKYKECMLYTTQARPFAERKYRPARATDSDGFYSEFANTTAKNLCISVRRKGRQKHGRKVVQQEGRESNCKGSSSPYPIRSMHTSQVGEKRAQGRPNLSIYEQNRPSNLKRHTYNHQCSSEREEEAENVVARPRDLASRSKKCTVPPAHTQDTIKNAYLEKRLLKQRQEQTLKDEDIDECEGEFLQPKISSHVRKLSIHNRLAPIDFNEAVSQKPSLVDLIKKFKFENLKTSNVNSSSNSIEDHRKYEDSNFVRSHSKQKTHPFFKETTTTLYGQGFQQRRFNRKPSKELGRTVGRGNLTTLKKSNSILSPWGTITDQYFVSQSPAD